MCGLFFPTFSQICKSSHRLATKLNPVSGNTTQPRRYGFVVSSKVRRRLELEGDGGIIDRERTATFQCPTFLMSNANVVGVGDFERSVEQG